MKTSLESLTEIHSFEHGFQESLAEEGGRERLAGALKEKNLFRVAYAYEQATDWHTRTPSL